MFLWGRHGGKPLASAHDFVLEHWQRVCPSLDVDALWPPTDQDLDQAAAFERCQGAAMDILFPGYSSEGSDSDRRQLVLALIGRWGITRRSKPSLANVAADCLNFICPVALEAVLDAGAQPGDVSRGFTILQEALANFIDPYARSAHALPRSLELLRLVLARTQPSDWLIGAPTGPFPLDSVAGITDPAISQVVLDCIWISGGFPARAVAASACAFTLALSRSTAACVKALLDAGQDPNVCFVGSPMQTPLHTLAFGSEFEVDAKLSLLLAAGARLEAVDACGWTPLVVAAVHGRASAYDALLAAGAQVSALRVNAGDSPAASATVLHKLASFNNAAMIERVLATGVLEVDVRAGPACFMRTPLHYAAERDAFRAVGALLAAGASLAATDTQGDDALQLAIAHSSHKAARLLVEATPPADRARYKRAAVTVMVHCHRAATAAPSDAGAAAELAAAQAVVALFA